MLQCVVHIFITYQISTEKKRKLLRLELQKNRAQVWPYLLHFLFDSVLTSGFYFNPIIQIREENACKTLQQCRANLF